MAAAVVAAAAVMLRTVVPRFFIAFPCCDLNCYDDLLSKNVPMRRAPSPPAPHAPRRTLRRGAIRAERAGKRPCGGAATHSARREHASQTGLKQCRHRIDARAKFSGARAGLPALRFRRHREGTSSEPRAGNLHRLAAPVHYK